MNSRQETEEKLNKYGRVLVSCTAVGELFVTNDGSIYRVMEYGGSEEDDDAAHGMPCRTTKCSFAKVAWCCSRPEGVEPCTFVNRDDDKNVYFKKLGNFYKQMDDIKILKKQLKSANAASVRFMFEADKLKGTVKKLIKDGVLTKSQFELALREVKMERGEEGGEE